MICFRNADTVDDTDDTDDTDVDVAVASDVDSADDDAVGDLETSPPDISHDSIDSRLILRGLHHQWMDGLWMDEWLWVKGTSRTPSAYTSLVSIIPV